MRHENKLSNTQLGLHNYKSIAGVINESNSFFKALLEISVIVAYNLGSYLTQTHNQVLFLSRL